MSVKVLWTLPTAGDGRSVITRGDFQGAQLPNFERAGLTDPRSRRGAFHDYLSQVARAAEISGFDAVEVPWNPTGEEPWIVAASLARHSRRLGFVTEIEPAFATPVYLAKMSVSFQRLAGNRLAWKLDLDRDRAVRRAHADFLEGDEWFQRADEFITAARGVWSSRPFDFRGRFYDVEAGGFEQPLSGWPLPHLYTAGASRAALEFAAKHADVHRLNGGLPGALREQVAELANAAARFGRKVRASVRLEVLARHTRAEAERDAAALPPAALVGSYGEVAEVIESYTRLGVDELVLDGTPRLEEAYRFGQHVLPRLPFRFASNSARAADAASIALYE